MSERTVEPLVTREELLTAIEGAGFRVAKSSAHPFLGPTSEDEWTLWCTVCGRDSGYHWDTCTSEQARKSR